MTREHWNECRLCHQDVPVKQPPVSTATCYGCGTAYEVRARKQKFIMCKVRGKSRPVPKVGQMVKSASRSCDDLLESMGLHDVPMRVAGRSDAYPLGMVLFCTHPKRPPSQPVMLYFWQVEPALDGSGKVE